MTDQPDPTDAQARQARIDATARELFVQEYSHGDAVIPDDQKCAARCWKTAEALENARPNPPVLPPGITIPPPTGGTCNAECPYLLRYYIPHDPSTLRRCLAKLSGVNDYPTIYPGTECPAYHQSPPEGETQ